MAVCTGVPCACSGVRSARLSFRIFLSLSLFLSGRVGVGMRLCVCRIFSNSNYTSLTPPTRVLYVLQGNAQRKFNVNAKVVLKACSHATMVSHKWEAASSAAILGADIAPKNFQGKRPQTVVTVTLLAALPPSRRPSAPYTFTVTTKFDGYDAENTASTTLEINYVRENLLIKFCVCSLSSTVNRKSLWFTLYTLAWQYVHTHMFVTRQFCL